VASGELDISDGYTCVQGRHDEGRPEQMGVDNPEPGLLADRTHPPVRGTPIETVAIPATEDRTLGALSDHEFEGPGCPWDKWHNRRLVALAEDVKGPVPTGKGNILDIRVAGLADPEAIEPERGGQGSVVLVAPLRSHLEGAELPAIKTPPWGRMDQGRRTDWAGLAAIRPSMWVNR
jgi:hypothetical protein